MTALLEVRGLHAHYGPSHILHGIDLTLGAGEAVALMGRNGMGKTTTIRAILGLTPPSRGAVRIKGRDVARARPYAIARLGIGYVPEGRGIFPTLTARENLVMAARPGPEGRSDWTLDRVLELFPRLAARIGSTGAQLSGGEQQMLTIGRALMTNPDLLILDEATEGLAPLVRREIWAVIKRIRATSMAALIVDKDLGALAEVADRVIVLAKGRVVYADNPAALAADAATQHRWLGV
ncbi:MAG: ABC transporter ATP-binding protein [Alphaproteobacteria bacterium]|nr:ABC transporter ATP-binding protein [Alphaproteobacteria bacterium]